MRRTVGLIYLGFFLFLGLSAVHGEEENLNVSFQVYLWPGGPMSDAGNAGDTDGYVRPVIQYSPTGLSGTAIDIKADKRRLSPMYKYTGPNPLAFFVEETNSNETTVRNPLGSVQLPKSARRALLLFFPKNNRERSYDILPIENSLDRIPMGKSEVYNLTGSAIACLFNDQSFVIEAGKSAIANLGPAENFSVLVKIGSEDDEGKWKVRHEQRLVVHPEDSTLTLIYNKPGSDRDYRVLVLRNTQMPAE